MILPLVEAKGQPAGSAAINTGPTPEQLAGPRNGGNRLARVKCKFSLRKTEGYLVPRLRDRRGRTKLITSVLKARSSAN